MLVFLVIVHVSSRGPARSVPAKITNLQSVSHSASQSVSHPSGEIKHTSGPLPCELLIKVNEQPTALHQVARLVAKNEAIKVFLQVSNTDGRKDGQMCQLQRKVP